MGIWKKRRMLIMGLTGPSGSGKGTAAEYFKEYGVSVIDTDAIYHDLLEPPSKCYDELSEHFGDVILSEDGKIDRKKIAEIVFAPNNQKELDTLNSITHRHILEETQRLLKLYKKEKVPAAVIDAPLLFESGFSKLCHICISVIAPKDLRLERIMRRDGLDVERAEARLNAQKEDGYYISRSDFTIVNDSDVEHLKKQIDEVIAIISRGRP